MSRTRLWQRVPRELVSVVDAHRINVRLVHKFHTFCDLAAVVAPDRHTQRVYLVNIGRVYTVNLDGSLIHSYATQHSWTCQLAAACDGFLCVASTYGRCGVYTPTGAFHSMAAVANIIDVNVARGGIVYVVSMDQSASNKHFIVLQLRCHDCGLCLEQKWHFNRPQRNLFKVCLAAHDEPLLLEWVPRGYVVTALHDPGHVIGYLGPFSSHPDVTVCQSLPVTNPGASLMVHRLDGHVVLQHWPNFDAVALLCAIDRHVFVVVSSIVYVYHLW